MDPALKALNNLQNFKKKSKQSTQHSSSDSQGWFRRCYFILMAVCLVTFATKMAVINIPQKCSILFGESASTCDLSLTSLYIVIIMGLYRSLVKFLSPSKGKEYLFHSRCLFTVITTENYNFYLSFVFYMIFYMMFVSAENYINLQFNEVIDSFNQGIGVFVLVGIIMCECHDVLIVIVFNLDIGSIHLVSEIFMICNNQRGAHLQEDEVMSRGEFIKAILTLSWWQIGEYLHDYAKKFYQVSFKNMILLP